ncbi:IS3 family transposase [Lactobacillus corticis]
MHYKKDKDRKNIQLIERIKAIFEEHKDRYGYRRITSQLHHEGF